MVKEDCVIHCDIIRTPLDDAGIMVHHVGITWEMEKSLRMVDPSTAAHYWDYTMEEAEGLEWYQSNIFEDDWFGSNSPDNSNHVVRIVLSSSLTLVAAFGRSPPLFGGFPFCWQLSCRRLIPVGGRTQK